MIWVTDIHDISALKGFYNVHVAFSIWNGKWEIPIPAPLKLQATEAINF